MSLASALAQARANIERKYPSMNTTTTPHSDQAATTLGRAEEAPCTIDHLIRFHEAEIGSAKAFSRPFSERYHQRMLDFLRAQSAELLALRADKRRLDWLEKNGSRVIYSVGYMGDPNTWFFKDKDHVHHDCLSLRQAIDAALNSPTQKSPAK